MKKDNRLLKGAPIAIELLSGERIFGKVVDWSNSAIWIIARGETSPTDVPRDIIQRALVLVSEVDNVE